MEQKNKQMNDKDDKTNPIYIIFIIFLFVGAFIFAAPYCHEIRYIITDCILDLDGH